MAKTNAWRAATALALALLVPLQASAENWTPERNVDYVVTAGPGAAVDTATREFKHIVDQLRLLPTTMLIVNRPGGNGMVALSALQARAGDGHVLVTTTNSLINNQLLGQAPLGYADFTPLAVLFDEFITVAVRADSPIKTGRDLVEALKKKPSSLSIGVSTSIGNHIHAAIAKPLKAAGVDISKLTVVPYKSSSETMTSLLGGHLDVMSASAFNVTNQLKNGKIRVLAVASAERLGGDLADVPTWREQGVDAVYTSSQGVLGAKGLTPAQIQYWEDLLRRVNDTPEWNAFLAKNYWKPRFMGHAEALKYFDGEAGVTKTLLGDLGLLKK